VTRGAFLNVPVDPKTHAIARGVRQGIADWIAEFAGQSIDIIVRKHRKQRSLDQNAYLHAEPFPKLAAAMGESVSRTKLICMGEFWGWEMSTAARVLLPVKAHTSDMTVEECTTFIDWLLPWALEEHGVAVELPETWQQREAA
jgi:hypothetical protein